MLHFPSARQCALFSVCIASLWTYSASPVQAAPISVTPANFGLDSAKENTGERSILVTIANTSAPSASVLINSIEITNAQVGGQAQFLSGEQDDAAIYTGLTLPTVGPWALWSNGDTMNCRVSWMPVDNIVDGDEDSGSWFVNLRVTYDATKTVDTSIFLTTTDVVPEPAAISLLAAGGMLFLRRRAAAC